MKGDEEERKSEGTNENQNSNIKVSRRAFTKATIALGATAFGIGVSHKYLDDLIETMDEDRIAIEMPDVPSKKVKAKAFDVKEVKDRLTAFAGTILVRTRVSITGQPIVVSGTGGKFSQNQVSILNLMDMNFSRLVKSTGMYILCSTALQLLSKPLLLRMKCPRLR